MKFLPTPLSGLYEIQTEPVADSRGSLVRLFCQDAFREIRPQLRFVQTNLSRTLRRGTVRGMHFQHPPAAEAKLIRCLRGGVYDVAVDLRAASPTFLRWHALELSADNQREIFIPEGFAHGFQALTDEVELHYSHTAAWDKGQEGGVRFDDPALGIRWPLPVTVISDKDRSYPMISDGFKGIHL